MIKLNEYIEVINKYPLLQLCNLTACIDDDIIAMTYMMNSDTINRISFYNKLQFDGVDQTKIVTDSILHETFTDIKKFDLALEKFFDEYRQLKKELRIKKIEEL